MTDDAVDLIDVKTGSIPRTVGAQTMGYARCLWLTPDHGVTCDADHRYWTPDGRELVSVSRILREGGASDEQAVARYTPATAQRGTDVHDALLMHFEGATPFLSETVSPYWPVLMAFLRESEFQVAEAERIVADLNYGYAGRFDMLGLLERYRHERTHAVRRWVLLVTPKRYRLVPLNILPGTMRVDRMADRRDESDFLAALTMARFRRSSPRIGGSDAGN